MAAIRMKLEGTDAMKSKLEGLAVAFPLEARRGTRAVAGVKMEIAKDRTPVKTGKLRDSAKLSVSIRKKGPHPNIAATIKFGGPDIPYASRVHELHKTQSKFLESVILESVGSIGEELSAEIDLRKALVAS